MLRDGQWYCDVRMLLQACGSAVSNLSILCQKKGSQVVNVGPWGHSVRLRYCQLRGAPLVPHCCVKPPPDLGWVIGVAMPGAFAANLLS